MILIGSSAIKHWWPEFPREPKDIDYITEEKRTNNKGVEYLKNPIFKEYKHSVMLPNDLYTLKLSHLVGWDLFWEKNMWDACWLKEKGCRLDRELFFKLHSYWEEYHGKNKRSDLEMSAEDFFDNALSNKYYHDDLHTLLVSPPTYTKILIGEVEVSENKFNKLGFEDKFSLVREEVMVMAWERWGHLDYRRAYNKMLKKFILNHAPIWEAIFILENYKKLQKCPFNYIKTINDGLSKIKPNIKKSVMAR